MECQQNSASGTIQGFNRQAMNTHEIIITRLLIGDIYLEMDRNNEPRIVMKDELGQEWVLDVENSASGYMPQITKKENSWFFKGIPTKGF